MRLSLNPILEWIICRTKDKDISWAFLLVEEPEIEVSVPEDGALDECFYGYLSGLSQ